MHPVSIGAMLPTTTGEFYPNEEPMHRSNGAFLLVKQTCSRRFGINMEGSMPYVRTQVSWTKGSMCNDPNSEMPLIIGQLHIHSGSPRVRQVRCNKSW